jgi:hypothetical protein
MNFLKQLMCITISLLSVLGFSQSEAMGQKLDSIIQEAETIYRYDKVVWTSYDLMTSKEELYQQIGSYIVYNDGDLYHCVFVDQDLMKEIARFTYSSSDLKEPAEIDYSSRPTSKQVRKLALIKSSILQSLNSNIDEYKLNIQEGFNPNLILIPEENNYKLYLIMGTQRDAVIPFGNDYLFRADESGKLTDWQKFHKTLIPTTTTSPGNNIIVSAMHSHLPMTPYISATDICTFRLYGHDLYGMNEFQVMSTALKKIFTYNAKKNTIVVSDF